MRLIKYIIVGAAVGYGINYITKKGTDGRSIMDDLTDKAPEWLDDVKKFAKGSLESISQSISR